MCRAPSLLLLTQVLLVVLAASEDSSEGSSSSTPSSRYQRVCNDAIEPTVGEIFSFVSPLPPEELSGLVDAVGSLAAQAVPENLAEKQEKPEHHWLLFHAFQELVTRTVQTFLDMKMPLASLVSDGVFEFNTTHYHGMVIDSDIKLLQKKPYLQRQFCTIWSFIPDIPFEIPLISPVLATFDPCQCRGGGLSLADAALSTTVLTDKNVDSRKSSFSSLRNEDDWCVFHYPCSEDYKSDQCVITVDPLRPACAVFLVQDGDQTNEKIEEDSSYHFHIPTLQNSAQLKSWLIYLKSLPLVCQIDDLFIRYLANFVNPLLAMIPLPYYPCMFLLAIIVLAIEDIVASSALVQLFITIILGVMSAAIVLGVIIYRNLQNFKTSIPFSSYIPSPVVTSFLSISLALTGFSLKNMIVTQLWNFWSHGAFGFPYIGKIYFAVSIAISLFLKYWYQWFEDGSVSHSALKTILRGISIWILVFHSSPSWELACLFVVIATWKDKLSYWEHTARMEFLGRMKHQPRVNYYGQAPLSQTDYAKQGSETTAKFLGELQQYMQNNVSEVYDITDRYRLQGEEKKARALERFAEGMSDGLSQNEDIYEDMYPSDDDDDDELRTHKTSSSLFGILLWRALIGILLCLLVAFVYRPVALSGGFSSEWFDELSEGALPSIRNILKVEL